MIRSIVGGNVFSSSCRPPKRDSTLGCDCASPPGMSSSVASESRSGAFILRARAIRIASGCPGRAKQSASSGSVDGPRPAGGRRRNPGSKSVRRAMHPGGVRQERKEQRERNRSIWAARPRVPGPAQSVLICDLSIEAVCQSPGRLRYTGIA